MTPKTLLTSTCLHKPHIALLAAVTLAFGSACSGNIVVSSRNDAGTQTSKNDSGNHNFPGDEIVIGLVDAAVSQSDVFSPTPDSHIATSDTTLPTDSATSQDSSGTLPSTIGASCQGGKCGGGLVCYTGTCHAACSHITPESAQCNERAAACGAQESCVAVSSLQEACISASATIGGVCNSGSDCPGGSLCVDKRCRKLCSEGCGSDEACISTNVGCSVCIKRCSAKSCNGPTTECGSNEACVDLQGSGGVCFPAVGAGEACGAGVGMCPSNYQCVNHNGDVRCRQVCGGGVCSSGGSCVPTSGGCNVCL